MKVEVIEYKKNYIEDYKLPFREIIYKSEDIMEIATYKKEKNGSFIREKEIKKYNESEMKKILENLFLKNFSEKRFELVCTDCKFLSSKEIIIKSEIESDSKLMVKEYKRFFEERTEERGTLYINGKRIYKTGNIYKIQYNEKVVFLYEDSNFYDDKETKKLIDFINSTISYRPQRQYMKNFIERNSKNLK